jgi:hypothetical protein
MSKLTWLGDSDPAAQSITIGGVSFVKGEATEVKDKALAEKLANNPLFSSDAKAETAVAIEPSEDELAARVDEGTEAGALKEQLRSLGVKWQGNPSVDTLRGKLAEALNK